MECTILILGEWATLKDWHWTSSSDELAEQLNGMLPPPPGPEDPQPEINEATKIAEQFGGKVISERPYIRVPGRVY
jgi:hypothetical protein